MNRYFPYYIIIFYFSQMKKQISFLFVWVLSAILLFVCLNLHFVPTYNSDISEQKISQNFFTKSYSATTDKTQNSWYIGLDKALFSENGPLSLSEKICVKWRTNTENATECLDAEENDKTGEFYTFPAVTNPTSAISFELYKNSEKIQENIPVTLYSLNSLPDGKKLVFEPLNTKAWINIISRSEWGADETIRYTDNPRQIKAYQSTLDYYARPKTDAELKAIKQAEDIDNLINTENAGLFVTKSLIRTENGHRLVWPIQTVNRVNKIVIHHTGDSVDGKRSDEEILRAIYSYHAITRGWWDIWYNFLIGQNGKVYEWRAWGDYVVGAHAAYNNLGSVGVSVLGDYETSSLNSAQEASLKNFIGFLVQKYGINVNSSVKWFRKCLSKNCYPIDEVITPALVGHMDVGYTDCPGKNIYRKLPSWRAEFATNVTPVLNTQSGYIEPKPTSEKNNITTTKTASVTTAKIINQNAEETSRGQTPIIKTESPVPTTKNIVATTKTANSATTITATNSKNETAVTTKYFWKKFRVKLSYPNNSITLSSYGNTNATAFLDYIRKPVFPDTAFTISPVWKDKIFVKMGNFEYTLSNFSFSAGAVKINSWNRVPDWDKNNAYNDNVFRDTIEVFNENGKLAVVNHLPLEWYLKGLGEVSNGDLPEKIKTITVAARSYANFYMDAKNRKYGTTRYDGSDDPDTFQKYIGYSYEMRSPNVAKFVDATAGEIIYYNGEAIKPWYFSSSNGRTLSYKEYCSKNKLSANCEDIPYLQSVEDIGWAWKNQSGHGVGISGIGSTYYASQGWDYKKIIAYYLSGAEVKK